MTLHIDNTFPFQVFFSPYFAPFLLTLTGLSLSIPSVLPAASAPVHNSVSRHRAPSSVTPLLWEKRNIAAMSSLTIDPELKPGEFVIKSLFAEFAVLAEKKIEMVMAEPLVSQQKVKAGIRKHRK